LLWSGLDGLRRSTRWHGRIGAGITKPAQTHATVAAHSLSNYNCRAKTSASMLNTATL
jgi:hypothetical protein